MTSLERTCWEWLKARHVGLRRAIPQAELAEILGIDTSDPTRTLQKILKDLREVHGLPAFTSCSGPHRGVFVPETMEEGERFVHNLYSRGWSNVIGARRSAEALRRYLGSQRPLVAGQSSEAFTQESRLHTTDFCEWCGRAYEVVREDQRFCTEMKPLCRTQWWNEQHRIVAAEGQSDRRAS